MIEKDQSLSTKFCVFVKVYNEYEMLEELVKSLLEQTLVPDEVIIIDDGSPDPNVRVEIERLIKEYPSLNLKPLRLSLKTDPNLDTVGRTFNTAWFKLAKAANYDFIATLDADTRLESHYYEKIITRMNEIPSVGCASGIIIVKDKLKEYTEQINIGAKFGRKDARGSGKVIRASILNSTPHDYFPEIDWDTWINTRSKVSKMKSPELTDVYMIQNRPTTRVVKKDLYRNGRLTYHFGYNPILLILKTVLAGFGGKDILKGYWNARKDKWRLNDKEVRAYFGWKFFLHF
ncbi:MAG: glycosyltransferase family 2 protein [Candidatus Hodarchaeales archaeon]|jgi:glycosyltransferase involved in cell wall biosynthesis